MGASHGLLKKNINKVKRMMKMLTIKMRKTTKMGKTDLVKKTTKVGKTDLVKKVGMVTMKQTESTKIEKTSLKPVLIAVKSLPNLLSILEKIKKTTLIEVKAAPTMPIRPSMETKRIKATILQSKMKTTKKTEKNAK